MAWDDDKSTAADPDNPSADEQLTATEWDNHVSDQHGRIAGPFPFPKWGMEKASGGGSVTFTDRQIQLREPGNASAESEARAFDSVAEFDPSVPGRVRVDVSNITIDNDFNAIIVIHVSDTPDATDYQAGDDTMAALARGDGTVTAWLSDDGSSEFFQDGSQDNTYISSLNYLQLSWDGSSITAKADDGSTEVTVSESNNYPSGETLHLCIKALDSDASNARNCEFDVDKITVGQ